MWKIGNKSHAIFHKQDSRIVLKVYSHVAHVVHNEPHSHVAHVTHTDPHSYVATVAHT